MEKILILYEYKDGEEVFFPNGDYAIEIGSFTYNASRMGGSPTISASIMSDIFLDDKWNDNVYTKFNGERYFIKNTPNSTKSNTDVRFKYDLLFVSERIALDNVYFFDVVDSTSNDDKPVSNKSSFSFSGTIHDFSKRLGQSLKKSGLSYTTVVDAGIDSETKLLNFDNVYFSSALQEAFNVFNIPYYFNGKEIHFGYTDNIPDEVFEYGNENALLSISKNNKNNRLVNRITGVGSSDNIPYYYPNESPKGEISIVVGENNKKILENNIIVKSKAKLGSKLSLTDKLTFQKHTNTVSVIDIAKSYLQDDGKYYYSGYVKNALNGRKKYANGYTSFTWDVGAKIYFVAASNGILTSSCKIDHPNQFWPIPNHISNIKVKIQKNDGEVEKYDANISYKDFIDPSFNISFGAVDKGDRFTVYIDFNLTLAVFGDVGEEYFGDVISNLWFLPPEVEYYYGWYLGNGSTVILENIGVELTDVNIEDSPEDYIGESFGIKQDKYIEPQNALMPPVYRKTLGQERFYNAINGKNGYKNPVDGSDYVFVNPYVEGKPKEHIQNFEDVKPSIVGMTNSSKQRIDVFSAIDFDDNDNDDVDEEGNYLHPYFYVKLRRFDGENGFNLFDQTIESGEMTISMTSGNCGACNFVIMVDSKTQKNTLQVDSYGNIVKDKDGKVVFGAPQDRQNNTKVNEVWLALKKDIDTFGILTPSSKYGYTINAGDNGDTFVILHIDLPIAYITAAEKRLEERLIQYMYENNSESFGFSIKFSRIYFAKNPDVLAKINENARIKIKYGEESKERVMYISSFELRQNSNEILPEITVQLADELTISQNAIQRAVEGVKNEIIYQLGNIDWLAVGMKYFLRKDSTEDVSRTETTFTKTVSFGVSQSQVTSRAAFDNESEKLPSPPAEINPSGDASFESINIKGNSTISGNSSIGGNATIQGKTAIKESVTIGNFIEEGDIIQGAQVTKEGVGSFAGLKSPFMQIYELIYNRKTAVQGEFAFSDGDTVEGAILNEDGTYTLILREQYEGYMTSFKHDDIVYANVNIIGKVGEAATTGKCWMRVNSVSYNGLSLNVSLYSDDQVPSKKNILPQPYMMITRHGNETDKTRQDVWIISSEDGRMYQLTGVDSPIINTATAYATVWGKLPQNLVKYIQQNVTNFNPNQPYLYARGAVIQDLILLNYKGSIVKTENYRGLWSRETAVNDPYVTNESTYDTVTHNGSKWMVQASGTIVEPSETVTEWTIVTAKGETGVSYSLKPSPSTVQVYKNQTKSVLSLDVTVVESGEDIIELTEQDELDERGLTVQFALDGKGERYDLEIGGVYAIEDENGEAVFVDESYDGEDGILYFEGEAIDLSQVQDNITIYLVKNGKDIAEQRVPVVKDGKDGEQGIQGIQGETGRSSFTSIVFLRSNPTPSTPQGGSYDSPIPTGWSDGIPDDSEERIWMSTRIFSSDGMPPQTEEWTKPEVVSSTSDMQIIFSSKETPQPPSGDYDETDVDWTEESSSETIWMAIRKNKDGIWGAWKTSKIKGEKGDDGTSIKVKGSLDDESQLPIPPEDASDCYIIGTDLYVWDGTTWKNVGKFAGKDGTSSTRLDLDNQNDSMLYDGDGNLLSGSITSKVTLYVGNEKIQDAQFGISNKNVEAELVDGVITVTACNAASGTVNVTCIYDGTVYTSVMSIKRIVNGARYEIVTNPTSVTYNETKDELSHNTVFIEIYRSAQDATGKFVRERLSTLPTGHLVAVLPSTGGSITVDYNSGATVAVDKSWEYFTVLFVDDYNTARLDEETIPVIRVKDGDNGENGHTYQLRLSHNILSVLVDATSGKTVSESKFVVDAIYEIDNVAQEANNEDNVQLSWDGGSVNASYGVVGGVLKCVIQVLAGIEPTTKNITISVTPKGFPTAYATLSLSYPQRGLVGPAGETGVMLYPAGYWDANTVYTQVKDEEGKAVATPFVYYQNKQGAGDYYVLQRDLPNAGIDPSTDDSQTYWKKFQPIQYLFTEALMANWARLAKSVFWGDYMFSTKGVNQAGEVVDHTAYMGTDNPMFDSETNRLTGALIPNLFLDLENGMVKTNRLSETFRPFRKTFPSHTGETSDSESPFADILNLETSYNVKCQSGMKILMMPLLADILAYEHETIADSEPVINAESVSVDGIHSIVSVLPDTGYEFGVTGNLNSNSSATTSCAWPNVINKCVLLCADPRILARESYKYGLRGYTDGVKYAPYNGVLSHAAYYPNEMEMFFSINGTLTKWILLEAGATVSMRLIDNEGIHIWVVENATDFEQLDVQVGINFDSCANSDEGFVWITGGVIGLGSHNINDYLQDLGINRTGRFFGSKRLRSLYDMNKITGYISVNVSKNDNSTDRSKPIVIADEIESINVVGN